MSSSNHFLGLLLLPGHSDKKLHSQKISSLRYLLVYTKLGHSIESATSKAAIPVIGTAWRYAKVEMIPPMSHGIVHGPLGKNLENSAAKLGQSIISGLEGRIKEMDMEVERKQREKEAAIKAAQEQAAAAAKAAAQAKADEKKRQDEAKAKEAKAKAEEKPKEEKKAEAPKAAAPAKPKPAKKKEPARKKEPKKNRRDEKKGKPPKK